MDAAGGELAPERITFTASGGKKLSNESSENSGTHDRMLGTGSVCKGQGDADEVQKEEEEDEEDQTIHLTI